MELKRMTFCNPSLMNLAAALQQIADMDELPRVAHHRRRTGASRHALNDDFKQLCRRHRDGEVATQADRECMLDLFASQLCEMGCDGLRAHDLDPGHVEMLVKHWLREGLSAGTLKNRMTVLRWLAKKTGKPNIVAKTNAAYGIRAPRASDRA